MHEILPEGYADFLNSLKIHIREARVRAALSVNRELVLLYWNIGKGILERQTREGWGSKVIPRLAEDLRIEFPDMKGISIRNFKYMRAFADAWSEQKRICATGCCTIAMVP